MTKPWVATKVAHAPALPRTGTAGGRRDLASGRIDPRSLGAVCEGCPFSKNGQPFRQVLGEFPANPQAVLVGETPGPEEAEVGKPFVGTSGRELNDALHGAGLDRYKMAVVNAVCCAPPPHKTDPMMRKAVSHCRAAFTTQLLKVPDGTPVLAMGKWAYVALTLKDKGVMKARGFLREGFQIPRPVVRPIEDAHEVIKAGLERRMVYIGGPRIPRGSSTLMVTWHPTYAIFHNPYEWAALLIDLDRLRRLLTGQLKPGPRVLLTHPTAKDVMRLTGEALMPGGRVAVDIETGPSEAERPWTGKDPMRAVLRTLGLGNREWGLSFEWEGMDPKLLPPVKKLLADERIVKVFQNGHFFDIPIMKRYGFIIR